MTAVGEIGRHRPVATAYAAPGPVGLGFAAMTEHDAALSTIDRWGAGHAAAAVVGPGGVIVTHGETGRRFRWASVTKLATALCVLVAAERGTLDLDESAGPPGSTVRHLLSHASGLPFNGDRPLAAPATRRIYSNTGFDLLGELVAERTAAPFPAALESWILEPLGMGATVLLERPSKGVSGPLDDLAALARELLRPTLLPRDALARATAVAFPGLAGMLPGVGRFDPCDWGLGFELHDGKLPHWMAAANSPATFGHFGGSGTFLWVDPVADLAVVVLTDRDYGPWALEAWPVFSGAVLSAATG
jgi:CubicO group peptidase (beta-lactamase class C family)